MMERTEILATMGALKLFGMKAGYDEIVSTAVKRQHEPQRVVGELLSAELDTRKNPPAVSGHADWPRTRRNRNGNTTESNGRVRSAGLGGGRFLRVSS